jgi:hypothetical protein
MSAYCEKRTSRMDTAIAIEVRDIPCRETVGQTGRRFIEFWNLETIPRIN